jgi:tungstate transport system substrate-binding protein
VAVGTGQALEIGRRGDADALLVHDRASEDLFLAEGHALFRRDVMYNDFVIVGPSADPGGIRGLASASSALAQLATRQASFVSRGDDSGTHKAELRLWQAAGIDPRGASGRWYRETGGGMGATLNVAAELPAYTLADRATWLAFRNRRELALLVEGDASLRNPYGVLVVNPALHPHVKVELATRFADWLTGPAGRKAIESFTLDGKPLFFLLPPTEGRFSPTTRP